MEITYFRVHYLVAGDKRRRLAESIADWLGEDVKEEGDRYIIDYFTLEKDGTLSFDDRADSDVIERLLEHLYDAGFEFAEDKDDASAE